MKTHHPMAIAEQSEILADVVEHLAEELPGYTVCGMTWEPGRAAIVPGPGTSALAEPYQQALTDLASHAGPWSEVRETGQPVWIEDTRCDERWRPLLWASEQAGIRALLCVPVMAGNEWIGTLDVYSGEPGPLPEVVKQVVRWAARYAGAASAEASAEHGARTLQMLFDGLPVMLYAADQAGRFVFVNRAAERLTGYSREALAGLAVTQLPEPEDVPKLLEHLHATVRGQGEPVQIRIGHRDGLIIPVEWQAAPLTSEGRMVGLAGSVRQPSPPSPELERMRCALEIAGLAVLDWDIARDQMYWSPEHLRILGLSEADVPPSWEVLLGMTVEDDRAALRAAVQTCLTSGQAEVRYRIRHPDGSMRTLRSRGRTLFGGGGRAVRMISVTEDVTEQEQADQLLRRTERLAVVGQLAAGVAHELRNPLTTVKGFVHLLKVSPSEETRGRYLDIIQGELQRIEQTINEFLLLGSPSGQPLAPCQLTALVQDVVQLMKAEAALHKVEIRLEGEGAFVVRCDAPRLKQVFVHVLKNAIEAMPDGGTVEVRTHAVDGEAVVEVVDHGRGIDSARLKTLGEPSYDTREKGTGLGLMISRRILEAHGGRLQIHSEVDEGTTVRIHLPLADDGPGPEAEHSS